VTDLRAGVHYLGSDGDFRSWFGTDADCLDYLEWLRWPKGFVCPRCEAGGGWATSDGRFKCVTCGNRTSTTAGTLFDRRRTPLSVWFAACWMFASQKDGVSALSLQRALEIGSYPTAWAMLHRLRAVLVRPGRDRLSGVVEVDETVIGGVEPGLSGGRSRGKKKSLVAVAVERKDPNGLGRRRMSPIDDASSETLRAFLLDSVVEGSTVVTDGWQAYRHATEGLYVHERQVVAKNEASQLMPGVHRVASLSKRWLLGPTRDRSRPIIWGSTSTSSCSGSTAAVRAAAGFSSTAFSSSPSPMNRCVIETSSSTQRQRRCRLVRRSSGAIRRSSGAIRRAWSVRRRTGRGGWRDLE
jgi:ISXO2-like transposase domain/Transposase zinc-ribbon domain